MRRQLFRNRPVAMRKIEQLWRLVRESHERPMTGVSRPVKLVDRETLGVTFIGHSSFLLQVNGRKLLVDPVFSKRLILLRRQRRPGVQVENLPPIDMVLLTHAHMDHLDLASLRQVVRAGPPKWWCRTAWRTLWRARDSRACAGWSGGSRSRCRGCR